MFRGRRPVRPICAKTSVLSAWPAHRSIAPMSRSNGPSVPTVTNSFEFTAKRRFRGNMGRPGERDVPIVSTKARHGLRHADLKATALPRSRRCPPTQYVSVACSQHRWQGSRVRRRSKSLCLGEALLAARGSGLPRPPFGFGAGGCSPERRRSQPADPDRPDSFHALWQRQPGIRRILDAVEASAPNDPRRTKSPTLWGDESRNGRECWKRRS